jgi:hypothetical protein
MIGNAFRILWSKSLLTHKMLLHILPSSKKYVIIIHNRGGRNGRLGQKRRDKMWISRQRAAVLMCQLVLCAGLALQAATAIAAGKQTQTQTTTQNLVPKELPKALPTVIGTLDPSSLTVGFGQKFTILGSCSGGLNAWLNSDPQGAFGNEIVDAGGGKSKWFGIAKLAGQSKITLKCYAGNDLSTATDVLATAVITVPDLRSAQDAYTKAKAAVAKLQFDLAASQAALDQAKLVCQQTPGCVAN